MDHERLNIGVIGLGRGFMLSLPGLSSDPRVRLAAAFDPRPEARTAFDVRFGAPTYADVDSLLADPEIDAVYIASPHEYHAEQAIGAALAGKHALVEKPMATDLASCRRMVEAASAAGTVLVVGPSHGFDDPVRAAAELVATGRYGRPRMVTALNYTDYLYRPRRPEELDTSRGGGVVFGQASHQIDVVRRLIGSPVASVRASVGEWDPARPTEGAYTALLTFEDGAAASLVYSGYGRYDSDALMDWISEIGTQRDPDDYGRARRMLEGADESQAKVARTFGGSADSALPNPEHHEHFGFVLLSCERADLRLTPTGIWIHENEHRHFHPLPPPAVPRAGVIQELVEAVLDGRSPVQDGRWGMHTMECCLAILRSAEENRDVSVGVA